MTSMSNILPQRRTSESPCLGYSLLRTLGQHALSSTGDGGTFTPASFENRTRLT
jgi:hypothetical protein